MVAASSKGVHVFLDNSIAIFGRGERETCGELYCYR